RKYFSATKVNWIAARQSNSQTLDIIPRRTIFESARAGSIRRDVSADETTALSRIGWVQQALCCNRALQVAKNHSGFRGYTAAMIFSNDFMDSIQFISGNDAAAERNAAGHGAGTGARNRHGSFR